MSVEVFPGEQLNERIPAEIQEGLAVLALYANGGGENPDDAPHPNGDGDKENPTREWDKRDAPKEHGPPQNRGDYNIVAKERPYDPEEDWPEGQGHVNGDKKNGSSDYGYYDPSQTPPPSDS